MLLFGLRSPAIITDNKHWSETFLIDITNTISQHKEQESNKKRKRDKETVCRKNKVRRTDNILNICDRTEYTEYSDDCSDENGNVEHVTPNTRR